MTFTPKDVILAGPILIAVLGAYVRLETRVAAVITSVDDLKRIVLNGHGKRKPTSRPCKKKAR